MNEKAGVIPGPTRRKSGGGGGKLVSGPIPPIVLGRPGLPGTSGKFRVNEASELIAGNLYPLKLSLPPRFSSVIAASSAVVIFVLFCLISFSRFHFHFSGRLGQFSQSSVHASSAAAESPPAVHRGAAAPTHLDHRFLRVGPHTHLRQRFG